MEKQTENHPAPPYEMGYVNSPASAPQAGTTTQGVIASPPPAALDMSENITYTTATTSGPQNTVVRLVDLADVPQFVDCPHCRSRQQTKIERHGSSQTLLVSWGGGGGWLLC